MARYLVSMRIGLRGEGFRW